MGGWASSAQFADVALARIGSDYCVRVQDAHALLNRIESLRKCPRGVTVCTAIKDEARSGGQ